MTIHEFAAMLNGREIDSEITRAEEKQAKELGYVVVYGTSDDLCELAGAIQDEAGACGGANVYIQGTAILERGCDCKYAETWFEGQKQVALRLEVLWCPQDGSGASWGYKLHDNREVATFDIMEGDELYCRGIVFNLAPSGKLPMPIDQIIASIAARIGPTYGSSPEVATSFVRKTLELFTTEYGGCAPKCTGEADEEKGA